MRGHVLSLAVGFSLLNLIALSLTSCGVKHDDRSKSAEGGSSGSSSPSQLAPPDSAPSGISPSGYSQCNKTLTPSQSINEAIGQAGGVSGIYTICLDPGIYKERVLIKDKENLQLLAPEGKATIESRTEMLDWEYLRSATLSIKNSNNITLKGVNVTNNYQFTGVNLQQVSRAIEISASKNVILDQVYLRSYAKQTLAIAGGSEVEVRGSTIHGYYFVVDLSWKSLLNAKNTSFRQHYETYSGDIHTMLWTHGSTYNLADCSFENVDGQARGLVSGNKTNGELVSRLNFTGKTTGNFGAWIRTHENYGDIEVHLYGSYPRVQDYFSTGPAINMKVIRH